MNEPKIIWSRIDSERRAQRCTTKRLASVMDISVNTISRDGKYPDKIPIGRLLKYYDALGISTDTLYR